MKHSISNPYFSQALIVLLLGFMSGLAQAQAWTRLGETDQLALYINRNSIERDGYIRRVWELQDLDRKSTRLNSSHSQQSRMPSSA